MSRDREVRIAVGAPDGPWSCVWKIWTSTNGDIYVVERKTGRDFKASLHASNRWRAGLTEAHMAGPRPLVSADADRAFVKWPRPAETVPGVTCALAILIPAGAVDLPAEPVRPSKPVTLLPIPQAGLWTEVLVFISPQLVATDGSGGLPNSVAWLPLTGTERVSVVAHHVPQMVFPRMTSPPGVDTTGMRADPSPRVIAQLVKPDGTEVLMECPVRLVEPEV